MRIMVMTSEPNALDVARDHGWLPIAKPFLPATLLRTVMSALHSGADG
jgi:hypothetical protein